MKKNKISTIAILCLILLCLLLPSLSYGEADWQTSNSNTGFAAVIEDQAHLLDETDLKKTGSAMLGITEFCNVGFYTYAGEDSNGVLVKARNWGDIQFPDSDYVVFVIDMSVRRLGVYSSEDVYKALSTDQANDIVSKTSEYATQGLYAKCAQETFGMIQEKLMQHLDLISARWIYGPDFLVDYDRLQIFNKYMESVNAGYVPVAYLGHKAEDTAIHAFLCSSSATGSDEERSLFVVCLQEDSEGNVHLLSAAKLDLAQLLFGNT